MSICPFCGLDPYEYVDVGVGGRGIPVAVNCCHLGPALFDSRGDKAGYEIAKKIEEELGDMPHGEKRFNKADELFRKYYEAKP